MPDPHHADDRCAHSEPHHRRPATSAVELLLEADRRMLGIAPRTFDDTLDDLARELFGTAALDSTTGAGRLARGARFRSADPARHADVEHLHVSAVIAERRGHPILVAALVADIGRRAGLIADVYSTSDGWFAGVRSADVDDPNLRLLSASPRLSPPDWRSVQAHCADAVTAAVLAGLAERYVELGEHPTAWCARAAAAQLHVAAHTHTDDVTLLTTAREAA